MYSGLYLKNITSLPFKGRTGRLLSLKNFKSIFFMCTVFKLYELFSGELVTRLEISIFAFFPIL